MRSEKVVYSFDVNNFKILFSLSATKLINYYLICITILSYEVVATLHYLPISFIHCFMFKQHISNSNSSSAKYVLT